MQLLRCFQFLRRVNRFQASKLVKMDFERAVSSSLRESGWEEMKKEQRKTLEAIGLDLREVLLLLLQIQKLLIVQVTALEPGWLWNREKQRCFETLIKTPISSPLTYVHNFPNWKNAKQVSFDTALVFSCLINYHLTLWDVLCYYFKWE